MYAVIVYINNGIETGVNEFLDPRLVRFFLMITLDKNVKSELF